jgi:deoxyribose-phosphate aldolase
MDIRQYLDSTYLKTEEQANLTREENTHVVRRTVQEAIEHGFKLVMIRPEHVVMARTMIDQANSQLALGTVIDFPAGTSALEQKVLEAQKAIADGADELDFVCNYEAYKAGNSELVKQEIEVCTRLALDHLKIAKWIIEVAALDVRQITMLSALIKNVVLTHFPEQYQSVFVKSSTGFYVTPDGSPNGATLTTIIAMLENAAPLPVKAAGGVRTFEEAVEMINLGVKRIGTSAALTIAGGGKSSNPY